MKEMVKLSDPALPRLQIQMDSDKVMLSWPSWASQFHLEYSTAMTPVAGWKPVNEPAQEVGESLRVIQEIRSPAVFCRFRQSW